MVVPEVALEAGQAGQAGQAGRQAAGWVAVPVPVPFLDSR